MVYKNIFTGTMRKFVGKDGFVSSDNGSTWTKNGTAEGLIKNLPYYKIV